MSRPHVGAARPGFGVRRATRWLLVTVVLGFFLPPIGAVIVYRATHDTSLSWQRANHDSSGQAPAPESTPEAVVQVYAARAFSWRGALGVHTWIALKAARAKTYTRLEVFGWGVRRGRPAILIREQTAPDGNWFGNPPELLAEARGSEAAELIDRIMIAAQAYPHNHEYRVWPGPNSNTFTAHIARAVPELGIDLPPTAIGKDYIPGGGWIARSPSGSGFQISLLGALGVLLGVDEGIEINLLGLTVGIDVTRPALKLPAVGRLGMAD